jgi:uncharacterized integral membrane protein (TIGR00697 family)
MTDTGQQRLYKYIDLVTAAFVAVLLISNIASTKALILGPFTFDGGTILFPLAYIFGDILTEVYGYARSRRVIWTGFFWLVIAALIFTIVDRLPPDPQWGLQDSFSKILGPVPQIVIASLIAYFAGEFSNSYILARMKVATQGRWLWMRTIGSTLVGEAIDTILFVTIAFSGVFERDLLLRILVSNYVFKVGVEVLFTPVTYQIVRFLKRAEHEDYYDRDTNFNPFLLTGA